VVVVVLEGIFFYLIFVCFGFKKIFNGFFPPPPPPSSLLVINRSFQDVSWCWCSWSPTTHTTSARNTASTRCSNVQATIARSLRLSRNPCPLATSSRCSPCPQAGLAEPRLNTWQLPDLVPTVGWHSSLFKDHDVHFESLDTWMTLSIKFKVRRCILPAI